LLKLSQQAVNRDEEELTGSEDPSVLYPVVANLPAQQAYKEGENIINGSLTAVMKKALDTIEDTTVFLQPNE